MLVVQQVTSGGRICYVGAVKLSFLKRVFDRPLPLSEGVAPPLEKVDKAVDEIARLIIERLSRGQTWWMGGFSFVINPFPSFQPLPSEQHESENSSVCGKLRLTETGSERWTPLDGYQRMLGMFKALSMLSGTKRSALLEDTVPVILLPATDADCQEMLLRMHKSARAVDRGETIRTTIDDKYARYAQWLMGEDKEHPGVIPRHLINWQSNTLTNRLTKFSTLSVLYDSARMLDETLVYDAGYSSSDEAHQYKEIANIWSQLLEEFVQFHKAVQSAPERLPSLRAQFLCLKPTGQLVVVAAIALALRQRVELPLEQVIERLSALPWRMDDPLWRNTIVVEGRVKGTRPAITLASRLAAHLIGLPLSDAEVRSLEQGYREAWRDENLSLPDPLFPPLG
jgi:hypothetical protein